MLESKSVQYVVLTGSDPKQTYDTKTTIGIAEALSPTQVINYVINGGISQVVQNDNLYPEIEKKSALKMLMRADLFHQFPLSTIFTPEDIGKEAETKHLLFSKTFNRSDERDDLFGHIEAAVGSVTSPQALVSSALLIVDELFMNAVYNACYVNKENSNSGPQRGAAVVHMRSGHFARIFLGLHEDRLVVGCEDSVGSLNVNSLLNRINDCYKNGLDKMIKLDISSGAGIGSFLIFDSCNSYYAAVEEDKRTTICCVIPTKLGQKKRAALPKNVHLQHVALS